MQSPLDRQIEMTGGRWVQSPFTGLASASGADANPSSDRLVGVIFLKLLKIDFTVYNN